MPSKLKKAIGAVKDQTSIGLAKVSSSSSSSSDLEVSVLKATTHDEIPVDEKYVLEVLRLVSSDKSHAAACARAIGKRIGRTRNWIVALKSLTLVLRIFQDGDPYFPREVLHAMKRGAKILNLSSFRDDSNSSPWDFTAFVRTFALYLDERLECFLTGKLQRRYKHHDGSGPPGPTYVRTRSRASQAVQNEALRDMKPAVLLDKLSYWQRLLDRAIATRPTSSARSNRLVQISLYAIVQESFELYRDISDGIALLLDSFFHMQYQNCVATFQTCVKAVKQYEELGAFYSLCKGIGVGRNSEYPSVQGISDELMESLQEFLKDHQSSFVGGSSKPAIGGRLSILPPQPASSIAGWSRSGRNESFGGRSEFSFASERSSSNSVSEFGGSSSRCTTSLEDLISATETWKGPSISIDLETYSNHQTEDGFRVSDTASCRSLPVSNSMADLMSLEDWSDGDEKDLKEKISFRKDRSKGILETKESKNWEVVLAETSSSSSSASASRQAAADNKTSDCFTAFPGQSQPALADINANTFSAFCDQASPAKADQNGAPNCWELVLFDAVQPQQPPLPPNNPHYNPFMEDGIPLPTTFSQQLASSEPTFQAAPTFSVQNQNHAITSENDPFSAFSGEQTSADPLSIHLCFFFVLS